MSSMSAAASANGGIDAARMPPSVTQAWLTYIAWATFLPTVLATGAMGVPMPWRLMLIIAVPAAVTIALEAVYEHPAKRKTTGLQFQQWKPSVSTISYKLLAVVSIFSFISLAQFVLHEYHKQLYTSWFTVLHAVWPWASIAGLVYVVVLDGYQTDAAKKADLYHNLGRLLLGRSTAISIPSSTWANMAREWLVKAFFLPMMIAFSVGSVGSSEEYMKRFVNAIKQKDFRFIHFFGCFYELIFYTDAVWATMGYVFSFKLLDTHVRSAEPSFLGWLAALACYPPFNGSIIDAYLAYRSESTVWGNVFADNPWLYAFWGSCILIFSTIYLWATIVFGVRFSNLTNRGIITTGPYAFTRHPAYIFKNLSWWFIAVPWSTRDGVAMALKRCIRIAGVNGIYYLRAMTEEAHLLKDPAYVDYYNAIQRLYRLPELEVPPPPTLQQAQSQAEAD